MCPDTSIKYVFIFQAVKMHFCNTHADEENPIFVMDDAEAQIEGQVEGQIEGQMEESHTEHESAAAILAELQQS